MSEPPASKPKTAWWRRRWVTIGEVVGVIALGITVLTYFDSHRQRAADEAEKAQVEKQAQKKEVERAALILTGAPADDGARLTLAPMRSGQAVQSQRYLFPHPVLDHPMEVAAAQPQIDRAWVAKGLLDALETAARARGEKLGEGEGALPVGVVTTYIEDAETRTDASLYRVGYRVAGGGLFGGRKLVLEGLSLVRRGAPGDLQAQVDARWRAEAGKGLSAPG